jgi:hypothetical protein
MGEELADDLLPSDTPIQLWVTLALPGKGALEGQMGGQGQARGCPREERRPWAAEDDFRVRPRLVPPKDRLGSMGSTTYSRTWDGP